MSYDVRFDEEDKIVIVTYIGTVTLEEREKVIMGVSSSYAYLNPLRLLFDTREFVLNLTLDEQKSLGEFVANDTTYARARIAVLHNKINNPNLVVDTYANINGISELAQFSNQRDAIDWLKGV